MKKFTKAIMTAIMAATMIVSANVTARAEEDYQRVAFYMCDVVADAKAVESGEFSATSIPLRIENDVCRVFIRRSWGTGDMIYEYEMLWGRYNPNPPSYTAEDIEAIILEALK